MANDAGGEREEAPSPPQLELTEWFNEHGGRLVLFVAIASAIAAIALGSVYSDELTAGGESLARVIRDIGLAAAVPPSAALALWRGCVAQSRAETDERQAETARMGHLNERYQKGVELLDSGQMMVRIGAIYALQDLAIENPESHLTQVVRVLCAFARHPREDASRTSSEVTEAESKESGQTAREDVMTAVRAAVDCVQRHSGMEMYVGLRIELQGAQLAGANFDDISLNGAQLHNADLCGASFFGANLRDSDLRDADLSGATLTGADLSNADLAGVELALARLAGANLVEAKLWTANLAGAYCARANFTQAQLPDANLTNARCARANFTQADLEDADLTNAWLHHCDLRQARLIGAKLIDSRLGSASLSEADLEDADLSGAHCAEASFTQADLEDADLTRANLRDANLNLAQLAGANLADTRLRNTNLTGATFSAPGRRPFGAQRQDSQLIKHENRWFRVARGMTQEQLDAALADPENPPDLDHVVDAETKEALVWRGGPVPSDSEGDDD